MDTTSAVLKPPSTKPQVSVARLANHWYVVCESRDLKNDPIARTILGIPMVLFRTQAGEAGALLDRCPHRNVPLSEGVVVANTLQCAYHGWRFSPNGHCVEIPGLCGEPAAHGREALSYRVKEQDGLIWIYCDPDTEPQSEPFAPGCMHDKRYTTVRTQLTVQATLHATLENILDVPHTAFLHGGLFRTSKKRNTITARVTRQGNTLETEYIGEPRPTGLMGKILAPQGGTVVHFDRFLMPSIAEVDYRLGERSHILASHLLTPINDFETQIIAVISFRLPLPGWMMRPILTPVFRKVFQQDASMLMRQSASVNRFGGERFVSTELDVMGPQIWQMLKRAAQGEEPPEEAKQRDVQMEV
jgi:phenylpropionate dioxygenase-like ring-hydroxylating dioxygenase large terminal subunit